MGDRDPQAKPEEQYPLLKVDGGGDVVHPPPQQSEVAPGAWGVTCNNKYSKFSRWPEFISACWMTLILCGISFLVFYALGMGVYRRHQFIIMKCNTSKPASNVFYHQIVSRGSQIPFVLYTEYLSYMAIQYPLLHFHVFFLVDDSYPDTLRGLRRNVPYFVHNLYKFDEIGKEALAEFQKRYQNVNVTIMPLSKYMAMTSLRFKYRLIPMSHLPFYIRVFSVWQSGGIGIDLREFNNDFHNRRLNDPRIDAILRQHNDGINTEDYTNALNKIDKDEENAVFNMFYGLINHFLNETRSFFNRTLSFPAISTETPLVRTHRSKRQISNDSDFIPVDINGTLLSDPKSSYIVSNKLLEVVAENETKDIDQSLEILNSTYDQSYTLANETAVPNAKANLSTGNGSETHQVVLFYDFSIFSDIGPTYLLSEPLVQPILSTDVKNPQIKSPQAPKTVPHLLSIDADGYFVAASSRFHPFLGHLISAGCLRMPPKFAIQDALLTQCSSLFREDVYCNNIYIL